MPNSSRVTTMQGKSACRTITSMRGQSLPAPPSQYAGELLSIGAAVNGAHDVTTRAHDALELIQNIVPFAAASIAGWDPGTDRHYSIATRGYPALPFLECVDAFPELTGMDQ